MNGNQRRRFLRLRLSAPAVAAVYCLATVAVTGLTITAIDTSAKAAPHGGGHGGGGHFGGGHFGGGARGGGLHFGGGLRGGPHGRVIIRGGAHRGHWFGGRPGWTHGHRYFWNSLWYCWYPVGYNGPGWYVCGANW